MKKYQMPNVKEEKLESSLFIMDGASSNTPEMSEGTIPWAGGNGAPKRSL